MKFEMSNKAQSVKVYNIRSDTKEFIGKSDCYIPAYTGLPANCSLTPPPEITSGNVAVYDGEYDNWKLVEDHRGEIVFSTKTGESLVITTLGPLPDDTVSEGPTEQYMKWDGTEWVHDAEAEKAAFQAKAESHRQYLLSVANSTIADWRTELQLEVITDDDRASLIKWMAYIKGLKMMDLSEVHDEAGYDAIDWPQNP
ncbi:TPA: tail fiber assembly protein [Kluyvera cryocrescens]|nr:tail fiber assembly protein [Kluyvera cryocrescens]